jgi:hypothetical protein
VQGRAVNKYINTMELILDHHYDFSKPIYLLHPSSKFWEVKIDGPTLTYRVGKIRDAI